MTKKRNRLQVIRDILSTIDQKKGEIKPTHILYKSNLSHHMMEDYLEELISKEFIKKNKKKKGKTYSITEKGKDYLDQYKLIISFTESFGLD
jgi:predicted transcriptional regulator